MYLSIYLSTSMFPSIYIYQGLPPLHRRPRRTDQHRQHRLDRGGRVSSKEGSYLRLVDFCTTQL